MDIHTALQLHSEHQIQVFFKSKNIDINIRDVCDQTPLHIASAQGMDNIVKKLIKKKADINARDSKGWTPLHCAANEQQYDTCSLLIQTKADVSLLTQDQASIFAYCVKGRKDPLKQVNVVRNLLTKLPELLDQVNIRKETPLNRACIAGSFDVIQFLIKSNSNVNAQTIEGVTCLHNAVRSGRKDVVKLLVDANANPELKNNDNYTPLEEAIAFGDKYMTEYLEEYINPMISKPPAQRRSIVSELVNVFNKSSIDQPQQLPIQRKKPPVPPPKDISSTNINGNNSTNDISFSKSVPSAPTPEIRELKSGKSKIKHLSKDDKDSSFNSLKIEIERLFDLLEEGNISSLHNSNDIYKQISEIKKFIEPKKRGRSSTFKTLKDKLSSSKTHSPPIHLSEGGNIPKRPPRPPRKNNSLESSIAKSDSIITVQESIANNPITLEKFFNKKNAYIDTISLPPLRTPNTNYLPNIKARQMTFNEILSTEEQYIRQLADVVTYYIRPLQNELSHLISSEDLKTIFFNFELIFKVTFKLFTLLLEEEKKQPEQQEIGQIFKSFKKDFEAYTPYCTSQVAAIETLEKLRQENKLFDEFLYSTQKADNSMTEDINGYLIKPFQRICRYVLLLKELLKQTPSNWKDKQAIEEAIESTSSVVKKANETQRVMDNLEKIALIQSKLDIDLDFKTAVKFIAEGDFKELDSRKNSQKRHFFLFTSLLIICKSIRGGKWQCKYNIPVEKCIIWNIPDSDSHKNCFQIVRTDIKEKIVFECKTLNEKEDFMSSINEAISPNVFSLLC